VENNRRYRSSGAHSVPAGQIPFCDAKVNQNCSAVRLNFDVAWLYVAVDDGRVLAVKVINGVKT
jgi:hypothetical protein